MAHKVNMVHDNNMLQLVHKAISKAKRLLLDDYSMIEDDSLQRYLNEFCKKFNRSFATGRRKGY